MRDVGAEGEIEEIELDERWSVAEELDIGLHGEPQRPKARALQPGAHDAYPHAQDQAEAHEPYRGQKTVEEARAVEGVVKDRQLDSGCLVEHPEPVPERLHGR